MLGRQLCLTDGDTTEAEEARRKFSDFAHKLNMDVDTLRQKVEEWIRNPRRQPETLAQQIARLKEEVEQLKAMLTEKGIRY
jgi:hypothetical protein